jgi:hypothetical protein
MSEMVVKSNIVLIGDLAATLLRVANMDFCYIEYDNFLK